MDTLQEFGIRLILILQQLHPTLDAAMNFFTFLGKIEFYLLIIPFLYWTVDKRLGIRMLLVLIATDIITSNLKVLFHQPRPYWLGKVLGLAEETSYGIPSSHASDSLAVWGYLAFRLKRARLWSLIATFLFFIGFSRLYLGVHFPHDVLFGWLLGFLMLWLFMSSERRVAAWINQQKVKTQIGMAFVLSLLVVLIGLLVSAWISGIPDSPEWSSFATQARNPFYSFRLAGSLFGGLSGYVIMKRQAPFENSGSWLQHLGRYALGIIVMLAIYNGLDIVFGWITPSETLLGNILRYVRYTSVTFTFSFLVPWIFLKTGLARREVLQESEIVSKAIPSEQSL